MDFPVPQALQTPQAPPVLDATNPPYNPLHDYGIGGTLSILMHDVGFIPPSRKRRARPFELVNEENDELFEVTTEYERLTRLGMIIVARWETKKNKLARAVVMTALESPHVLTSVKAFESKLYTALSNVVWVNERELSMCAMSRHEASGLAAFVSSIVGTKKSKEAHHGPIRKAVSGESISREDENEMHQALRSLGYDKLEIPRSSSDANRFWDDLYLKYGDESSRSKSRTSEGPWEVRALLDDFWKTAIKTWIGPRSDCD